MRQEKQLGNSSLAFACKGEASAAKCFSLLKCLWPWLSSYKYYRKLYSKLEEEDFACQRGLRFVRRLVSGKILSYRVSRLQYDVQQCDQVD